MAGLTRLDALPDGFLDCSARDLQRLVPGPALIQLPGRKPAPLFVSVLQHGNETSGFEAVQQVLRQHSGRELPRALMLFVGNVVAAGEGLRRLDTQPDFNRIWPGATSGHATPEASAMAEVHARVLARQAFAAVDLHNNTGRNPHYSVVCSLDAPTLHLAALFSRRAVWFSGLPGTQTASFAGKLPAITAECGLPGVGANAEAGASLVEALLDIGALPERPVAPHDLDVFHTLATVRVRPEIAIGEDLRLEPALEDYNFRDLPAGARFGTTSHAMPLEVIAEDGRDVTGEYFAVTDGTLRLHREAMPAMLTCDARVIRQDCLCYLMERVPEAKWCGVSRAPAASR